MVNLLPQQTQRPIVDIVASQTLANARTAAEYVSRALEMRAHNKAPHSSYVKYDVYEKEETQQLPEPSQIEVPQHGHRITSRNPESRTKKRYADYEYHRKPEQTPTTYTMIDNENSYSHHHGHHDEVSDHRPNDVGKIPIYATAEVPKAEIINQIKLSVIKYMKELEADGNFPAISAIATTAQPHTEIKTYYRFPSSTVAPTHATAIYEQIAEQNKQYPSYGHSQYYKNSVPYKTYQSHKSASSNKVREPGYTSTTMVPSYSTDSYESESVTPHIDLTFRSKARPKPIDLAALDVGQSWSHDSVYDQQHSGEYRGHRQTTVRPAQHYYTTPKPKLHFSSQTYHDINSMTYSPVKGLHTETEQRYNDQSAYGSSHVTPVHFRDISPSVGTSFSVVTDSGESQEEPKESEEQQYRGPVHVINGIPVSNPYKFNFEQLK